MSVWGRERRGDRFAFPVCYLYMLPETMENIYHVGAGNVLRVQLVALAVPGLCEPQIIRLSMIPPGTAKLYDRVRIVCRIEIPEAFNAVEISSHDNCGKGAGLEVSGHAA